MRKTALRRHYSAFMGGPKGSAQGADGTSVGPHPPRQGKAKNFTPTPLIRSARGKSRQD